MKVPQEKKCRIQLVRLSVIEGPSLRELALSYVDREPVCFGVTKERLGEDGRWRALQVEPVPVKVQLMGLQDLEEETAAVLVVPRADEVSTGAGKTPAVGVMETEQLPLSAASGMMSAATEARAEWRVSSQRTLQPESEGDAEAVETTETLGADESEDTGKLLTGYVVEAETRAPEHLRPDCENDLGLQALQTGVRVVLRYDPETSDGAMELEDDTLLVPVDGQLHWWKRTECVDGMGVQPCYLEVIYLATLNRPAQGEV